MSSEWLVKAVMVAMRVRREKKRRARIARRGLALGLAW